MITDPNSPQVLDAGQGAVATEQSVTTTQPPVQEEGQAHVESPHSQDSGPATSPPQTTEEESFFNPADIPVELQPAYKQMQGAFTKKTTEIARHMDKVKAFDAFNANPFSPEMMQFMAQRGYVPAQMQQQQQQTPNAPYEPESWDALLQEAEARAERRIMERLQPYFGQVQQMGAQQVEAKLNQLDPKWREYEPEMLQLIQEHPSLVRDPQKLYRLAVPQEVFEARITQAVLDKQKAQAAHAATQTRTTTPRSTPAKPKISSWEEAVADAQQRVRSGEV